MLLLPSRYANLRLIDAAQCFPISQNQRLSRCGFVFGAAWKVGRLTLYLWKQPFQLMINVSLVTPVLTKPLSTCCHPALQAISMSKSLVLVAQQSLGDHLLAPEWFL